MSLRACLAGLVVGASGFSAFGQIPTETLFRDYDGTENFLAGDNIIVTETNDPTFPFVDADNEGQIEMTLNPMNMNVNLGIYNGAIFEGFNEATLGSNLLANPWLSFEFSVPASQPYGATNVIFESLVVTDTPNTDGGGTMFAIYRPGNQSWPVAPGSNGFYKVNLHGGGTQFTNHVARRIRANSADPTDDSTNGTFMSFIALHVPSTGTDTNSSGAGNPPLARAVFTIDNLKLTRDEPFPPTGGDTAGGTTGMGDTAGGTTAGTDTAGGTTGVGTDTAGGTTGVGTDTAGTTTGVGTDTAGTTTGVGTDTAGTTTGGGTDTAGTTTGGGTNAFVTLNWTITVKKPKAGKAVKFKAGKKGLGTLKGDLTNIPATDVAAKTAGVKVQVAAVSANDSNGQPIVNWQPVPKVGKVSKKGKVKFSFKKFESTGTYTAGQSVRLFVQATTPTGDFSQTATPISSNTTFTIK